MIDFTSCKILKKACGGANGSKITDCFNTNFVLTNLILSMPGSFTITDVCDRLNQHSLVIHANVVKKAIERLRDNDYLDEIGCTYTVIPQENSRRW